MAYQYRGLDALRRKLNSKRVGCMKRYKYYNMHNQLKDFNITMPEKFRWMKESLGWCTKAVDSIADRLSFYQFDNDLFDMNTIFLLNNSDILFDSAIKSALITSCSFIFISKDDEDQVKLQNISGMDATGYIDPVTYMLYEGYAVLERDVNEQPTLEAYFIPGETWYYPYNGEPYVVENAAPYPLLVPIIYRPDADRAFGHSRISRACMDIQQGAMRTLKRAEVSAEFYSFPQKYVLGTDPDNEPLNKWKATMSSLLEITKDENGDRPTVGQFQQQSMAPYVEQMRMFAALFAGETGLTLDDLGFVTDNPSSAEAIKASHENLRLYARKAQKTFGIGFLNTGYLASCIRDSYPYRRNAIYNTKPVWQPIFEPDMATLSLIGDGVIKLNQAVPGYFNRENLRQLTGIEAEDE